VRAMLRGAQACRGTEKAMLWSVLDGLGKVRLWRGVADTLRYHGLRWLGGAWLSGATAWASWVVLRHSGALGGTAMAMLREPKPRRSLGRSQVAMAGRGNGEASDGAVRRGRGLGSRGIGLASDGVAAGSRGYGLQPVVPQRRRSASESLHRPGNGQLGPGGGRDRHAKASDGRAKPRDGWATARDPIGLPRRSDGWHRRGHARARTGRGEAWGAARGAGIAAAWRAHQWLGLA
jgi:hypothetical protein